MADEEKSLRERLQARWRRSLRPPRRAIPTVPGLFALAAPTFLGLAAVTATNNLLFLILGATLGAIVLSGILSERNVRPISAQVRPLGPIYAGEEGRLEVRLERARAEGAALDLRFREAPGRLLSFRRYRSPEVLDVHLPVLEGRRDRVVGRRRFEARGECPLHLTELSTRYPFGLLVKAKDVETGARIRVRPARVEPPAELRRPPGVASQGEASNLRGAGLDVYGLRERMPWDADLRVHARRSLALGRPVVLEMAGTERPHAELGLALDGAEPEALERSLEVLQSVLQRWEELGYAVGLTTAARSFAPGEVSLDALLDHLVDVETQPATPRTRCPGAWIVPEGASAPAGVTSYHVDEKGALRSTSDEEAAA